MCRAPSGRRKVTWTVPGSTSAGTSGMAGAGSGVSSESESGSGEEGGEEEEEEEEEEGVGDLSGVDARTGGLSILNMSALVMP